MALAHIWVFKSVSSKYWTGLFDYKELVASIIFVSLYSTSRNFIHSTIQTSVWRGIFLFSWWVNTRKTDTILFQFLNEFYISEPGMYKQSVYGIRLKNVLEVYDTGKRHDKSGARFLGFRDVSLVPFDSKLIDRGELGPQEVNLEIHSL